MSKHLVIFEDRGYRNLLPLTWTRPACRLRCGIVTLWDKIAAAYPDAAVAMHSRPEVAAVVAEEVPEVKVNEAAGETMLLINGRLLAPADLAKMIPPTGPDVAYVSSQEVVAARVSGARGQALATLLSAGPLPPDWHEGLPREAVDVPLVKYPWELVHYNAAEIQNDFIRLGLDGQILGEAHPSAVLTGAHPIHVGEGAKIQPGAVLYAEEGPIYIGPGATIMAGAVLQGPVAIGRKSSVKMQAKIYEGVSMGEFCKVGGEVEESIFQAYSNKQHDGFLGHAFLGEWINLGADTNNSDLKNNYSTVTVTIDGDAVDSGSLFVGSVMGDHTKIGINTMLNTGTVLGVGCNVYGGDFPPKYVPSFCWGGSGGFVEHTLEKFLVTTGRVMARRKRALTPATRAMLEGVFRETVGERRRLLGG